MGGYYSVTCRNKACKYYIMIRAGVGMHVFREMRTMEQKIINGEIEADEKIKSLLQSGEHFKANAVYLCPECREWKNVDSYFIFEKVHVSPYGTVREYKLHYLNKEPVCEECGSKLVFILNPRAQTVPCPKCGTANMISRDKGNFD